MGKDIIVFEINKKIQDDVCAFGVRGGFIFAMMAWLIVCFIILMAIKSYLGVILASITVVILFFIAYGIASYLSKRYSIRLLMRKIGSYRQPSEIICLNMKINIRDENN